MPKMVTMVKGGKEVKVVESAFQKVWKDKGWSLKGVKKTPAPKPPVQREESATSE